MSTSPTANDRDLSLVGHVTVSLVAEIGTAEMSISDLFALNKHDIVKLDQSSDAWVTLLLNGKPVARGELMAVEDQLGIRITEIE